MSTDSETGTITIVPSVHFSPTHARRVRETIREVAPDLVAVELDEQRFEQFQRGADADVFAPRDLPAAAAATYTALRFLQRSVVRLYGLDPEETDMEVAIQEAATREIDVALIDEPITETLEHLARRVGLHTIPQAFVRSQFLTPSERFSQLQAMTTPFSSIEDGDDVEALVEQFRHLFPDVAEVLIDRRDRAMARRLHTLRAAGHDVVAVVGAGHHNGIEATLEALEAQTDVPTMAVPIRTPTQTVRRIPIE